MSAPSRNLIFLTETGLVPSKRLYNQGDITLAFQNSFVYGVGKIPGFSFDLLYREKSIGGITLLIENDEFKISEEGHIGMHLEEPQTTEILVDVAHACFTGLKDHGIQNVLITHQPDNDAIEKVCGEIAAMKMDDSKEGRKCYKMKL